MRNFEEPNAQKNGFKHIQQARNLALNPIMWLGRPQYEQARDDDEAQVDLGAPLNPEDNPEGDEDEPEDNNIPGPEDQDEATGLAGDPDVHENFEGGRSSATFTKMWKAKLRAATTASILSPRVNALIDVMIDIREKYPTQKIMVVSDSLMFLDVIEEAVGRVQKEENKLHLDTARFDGSLDDEVRAEHLRDLNMPLREPRVLLVSARSGGTGLNITGASHLILTEPFWNPGLEEQVIGRLHRMGQRFVVHV